ncbi:hypothetical protein ACFP3I_12730 [Chryseobacterium arachidis]|uniref:hypothetical protein n=1 Tax=Chryseobacterium arachidis TaxID=1416778 RepID=UPI003620F54F
MLEKYDKAVLFLNSGLVLNIIFSGYYVVLGFLSKGWNMIATYPHFKFFVLFIVILIIVNMFKIKQDKGINEIEEIGKHND